MSPTPHTTPGGGDGEPALRPWGPSGPSVTTHTFLSHRKDKVAEWSQPRTGESGNLGSDTSHALMPKVSVNKETGADNPSGLFQLWDSAFAPACLKFCSEEVPSLPEAPLACLGVHSKCPVVAEMVQGNYQLYHVFSDLGLGSCAD